MKAVKAARGVCHLSRAVSAAQVSVVIIVAVLEQGDEENAVKRRDRSPCVYAWLSQHVN